MTRLLLILGILILFAIEILRVYFIMPFPGSQHADTIGFAYFIDRYRWPLRIACILFLIFLLRNYLPRAKGWVKALLSLVLMLYAVIFYFFNFRFEADKMFYQPRTKTFAGAAQNKVPLDKLVIGVVINKEAKAFPIQVIGYHHQVRDTIGNEPVMITYCTVCRTGRVFSLVVNGHLEDFRLVGMDHFNAMFEDAGTKSWWRQATGVAIAGPLKNMALAEIPSVQTTLSDWLRQYPDAKVLQPDTVFNKQYSELALYDKGTVKSGLEKRDSASWKAKSWVIGIQSGAAAKAYDWNDLLRSGAIHDTIGDQPVTIILGKDSVSFTAYAIKDNQLQPIQAYQEFWHSWRQFHPATTQYKP